jgi:hypothetical protein
MRLVARSWATVPSSKARAFLRRQILETLPTAARHASSTSKAPEQDSAQDQKAECLSIVQAPNTQEQARDNGIPQQHHDNPKNRDGRQDQGNAPCKSGFKPHMSFLIVSIRRKTPAIVGADEAPRIASC